MLDIVFNAIEWSVTYTPVLKGCLESAENVEFFHACLKLYIQKIKATESLCFLYIFC